MSGIRLEAADATACEWPGEFDAVVISAALPQLTSRYTDLLKPGGRLFVFTGTEPVIRARLVTKSTDGSLATENLFETSVEPMTDDGFQIVTSPQMAAIMAFQAHTATGKLKAVAMPTGLPRFLTGTETPTHLTPKNSASSMKFGRASSRILLLSTST